MCHNLIETDIEIMARKRVSDEDILKLLHEIEAYIHGMDVVSTCRKAGISDKTTKATNCNSVACK